ncbi:MAG: HypC/HybG/HupF family hydrogenase formation chaperone [Bacteroidales bacterium]|jgi:hydrogenase expression/formation protein HypC|nr:HypC/HybG/HupF family hydrogenase formation chaperone [Bacteroidales bacterium]
MCLAIPGKIISIDAAIPEMTMAKVDFGGIIKPICVQWVNIAEGDYILAHAGMAISVIDAQEAEQTLADFDTIARSLDESMVKDSDSIVRHSDSMVRHSETMVRHSDSVVKHSETIESQLNHNRITIESPPITIESPPITIESPPITIESPSNHP